MISINLGPKDTDSAYTIPSEDWTAINQRVSWVGVFADLPIYPNLLSVCNTWKTTTFPGIVSLANAMIKFIDNTVATNYPILQSTINELNNGPIPKTVPDQFNQAIAALESAVSDLEKQTAPLATQITEFIKVNRQADEDFEALVAKVDGKWLATFDETFLNSVIPPQIEKALGTIKGRWSAINSDIVTLKQEVSSAVVSGEPLVTLWNLQGDQTEWNATKNEIQGFISNAGEQK